MDTSLHFGTIRIVEWLRPDDKVKTGWDLFNEVQPMGLMSKPHVTVTFDRVATRAEFTGLLRRFETDIRRDGRIPLLHIETHGNDDGIGVSQEEGFTFYELLEELIPLNTLTHLRLPVFLAACEGIWGIKMLQPATRAAALAIFGPNREVWPSELARACTAFYRTIFHEGNGNLAYQRMNEAIDPAKATFGAFNAEMAFTKVYRQFLKEMCSEQGMSVRIERWMALWQQDWQVQHGRLPLSHELEHARAFARMHIRSHQEHFERFRREFFMIDLYPENEARFPITFEQLQADDADSLA
jgi:hypothetical protein